MQTLFKFIKSYAADDKTVGKLFYGTFILKFMVTMELQKMWVRSGLLVPTLSRTYLDKSTVIESQN